MEDSKELSGSDALRKPCCAEAVLATRHIARVAARRMFVIYTRPAETAGRVKDAY